MKINLSILSPLFHLWFYIMVFVATVLLSPFLLITTIKESWYPYFYKVARVWSAIILFGTGCIPKYGKKVSYTYGDSYMFIANHRSMLDIMMMFYSISSPFVFVGKKELAKLPIFGFFYKRTCILVDRANLRSKNAVIQEAHKRINNGLSVCIFPEGGIPDDSSIVLDRLKDGAFRLAIEHQIPIAALVFHDNGKRLPYNFFKGGPGRLRVEMLPLVYTTDTTAADKFILRNSLSEKLLERLESPQV